MADEDTQGQEDTLWWALDDLPDASSPGTGFDEPLVWPESLVWDDDAAHRRRSRRAAGPARRAADRPRRRVRVPAGDRGARTASCGVDAGADRRPRSQLDWRRAGGHGLLRRAAGRPGRRSRSRRGATSAVPAARPPATGDNLPDSIWSDATDTAPVDGRLVSTTPAAATAFYAEADSGRRSSRGRRFDIRHGNAGVIALISLASLVLLGMFLSVRARNDVPTDSSSDPAPARRRHLRHQPAEHRPAHDHGHHHAAGHQHRRPDPVRRRTRWPRSAAAQPRPPHLGPPRRRRRRPPRHPPPRRPPPPPRRPRRRPRHRRPRRLRSTDTTSTTARRTTTSFTLPTFPTSIPGGGTFPTFTIPTIP